jgi:hypothetical protein
MCQGSDSSCQLLGLEENTTVSVRVCYEVEQGRSHWRFRDLRTKSSENTHQSAAGIYIAKFLSKLWDKSYRKIETEITASWDAARQHLLLQVDPDGTNSFASGSDDELLGLTTRLIEAWNWKVLRSDDDQRPLRVISNLLLSPTVLQRLTRTYGVDFLVNRVLKLAVSNVRLALKRRRPEPDLIEEFKMLKAVLQIFETQQNNLRRAPTTTIGHIFSEAICGEPPDGEDEADISALRNVANLLQTSLRELVDEAVKLVHHAQDSAEEQRDKDVGPKVRQMLLRLDGALEAGCFEVFDSVQEKGEMECAIESASEKLHDWVQVGGKKRLFQIFGQQAVAGSMPPTPREQAKVGDTTESEAQANQGMKEDPVATAQIDQSELPEQTNKETDSVLKSSPRKTPSNSPRKTPASTPRREPPGEDQIEEEAAEAERTIIDEQNQIMEVAALLSMGALDSSLKSRALIRLDLPFDVDDPDLWGESAKSFYMVRTLCTCVECVKTCVYECL